jgi:hypothetical protein
MDAENPPIARSDDGRSFLVGDAAGTTLVAGSLVVVSGSGERQLALVEERSETQPVRLRGRLIGVLAEVDSTPPAAFRSRPARSRRSMPRPSRCCTRRRGRCSRSART